MRLTAEAKLILFRACTAAILGGSKQKSEFSAEYEESIAQLQQHTSVDEATVRQYVLTVARQYQRLVIAGMLKEPSDRRFRDFVNFCERTFGMIREEAALKLTDLGERIRKVLDE